MADPLTAPVLEHDEVSDAGTSTLRKEIVDVRFNGFVLAAHEDPLYLVLLESELLGEEDVEHFLEWHVVQERAIVFIAAAIDLTSFFRSSKVYVVS